MHTFSVGDLKIGPGQPLSILCGPCVMEGEEHTLRCAEELVGIFGGRGFVFKASYDKANRSSVHSFRGPGLEKGLRILERVKREFGLPVVTDVHTVEEAKAAGAVCDMIQIPAFLSRQTDLVHAAGSSGAAVNVKKGQFLAPWDMKNVVEKLEAAGCQKILLTDRGTTFGYNNLVSDFRAIPIMQGLGYPVCFDATHSVQLPGGLGNATGGQREFIPVLAKAAVAAGANALFLEAHPKPSEAKSDAASVLSFDELKALLPILLRIYEVCSVESTLQRLCSYAPSHS
jgi:2-dehydro-3-deoxyphosphooctonate aldolase (KDO 8-P synthase)